MLAKIKWISEDENIAVLLIRRNKKHTTPIFIRAYQDKNYYSLDKQNEICKNCCVASVCRVRSTSTYFFCSNIFYIDSSWVEKNLIREIFPVNKEEQKNFRKNLNWKKYKIKEWN